MQRSGQVRPIIFISFRCDLNDARIYCNRRCVISYGVPKIFSQAHLITAFLSTVLFLAVTASPTCTGTYNRGSTAYNCYGQSFGNHNSRLTGFLISLSIYAFMTSRFKVFNSDINGFFNVKRNGFIIIIKVLIKLTFNLSVPFIYFFLQKGLLLHISIYRRRVSIRKLQDCIAFADRVIYFFSCHLRRIINNIRKCPIGRNLHIGHVYKYTATAGSCEICSTSIKGIILFIIFLCDNRRITGKGNLLCCKLMSIFSTVS